MGETGKFDTFFEVLHDYCQISSIAGVQYFKKNQTWIGIVYWTTFMIGIAILSTYWSGKLYLDWKADPVMTDVSSVGNPISNLPFPGVVFCHDGTNTVGLVASILWPVIEKMKELNNESFIPKYSAYQSAFYLERNAYRAPVEMWKYSRPIFFNGTNILFSLYPYIKWYISVHGGEEVYKNYYVDWMINDFFSFVLKDYRQYQRLTTYPYEIDQNETTLAVFFNPDLKQLHDTDYLLMQITDNMLPNEMNNLYHELLKVVWYSKLPCFDILNLTANHNNENSFIKNCRWKGIRIPCGVIFDTVLTDNSLCCGFNLINAEDLYVTSVFQNTMTILQKWDKAMAFENTTASGWIVHSKMLMASFGVELGLQVTLDGHTDILDLFSMSKDFNSFTGLIVQPNVFPLTLQSGFAVRRGYLTRILLTGNIISADPSVANIDSQGRGCLFPNEFKMKYFRNYSQGSCLFECAMAHASGSNEWMCGSSRPHSKSAFCNSSSNTNFVCIPWNFPHDDKTDQLCNPHFSKSIIDSFNKGAKDELCIHCLPDCSRTVYSWKMSMEPLRECDDFNIGISPLCNIRKQNTEDIPYVWYQGSNVSRYSKFRKPIMSVDSIPIKYLDKYEKYDAYRNDIGVVSIFFDTHSVITFAIQTTSTWAVFFSNVGGILGLFIGFGVYSLVEIWWLFYTLCRI